MKRNLPIAVIALALLAAALPALAAPVAYVKDFPAGEELTEFLEGKKVKGENPADVEKAEKESPKVLFVVEPLSDTHVTVSLYNALYDGEIDAVLPDGAPFNSAELSDGEVYLFSASFASEGLPQLIVYFTAGLDHYVWIPGYSAMDDSLETNEFFIPWAPKDER